MSDFFHVTSAEAMLKASKDKNPSLMSPYLISSTHESAEELVEYYEDCVKDEGLTPIVLRIPESALDTSDLEPDYAGISEPITTALGISEEEVLARWEGSDGLTEDSLSIVGSARYPGCIEFTDILIRKPGAFLGDFTFTPLQTIILDISPTLEKKHSAPEP